MNAGEWRAGVEVLNAATRTMADRLAWQPVGDSREANSPEVTAWGRTSSSFLAVVRHIVIGLEAALPKIYTTINQHRQPPLIFNVKGGDVVRS